MIRKHLSWSARAEQGLAGTLGEDRASIVEGVNSGRLELWEVGDGELWLVTCCDTSGESPELVLCCVKGRGLAQAARVFAELGRKTGCKRARWFSSRRGWDRLLGMQVELAGYVYHVRLEQVH